MIEVLLLRLLFQPELHDAVVKHRQHLKWAAAHGHDNLYWDVLDTVLLFDEKFGKLPSRKSLLEFCATADDPVLAQRIGVIDTPIKELKDNVPKEALDELSDADNLIDGVVKEARREFYLSILRTAQGKVVQGPKPGKEKEPYGPDGAMAFLRRMLATDLTDLPPELAGIWQDNTEFLKQQMADYREQKAEQRILLGFPRMDATFVVKQGKTLFIAGSSGDGKSTWLHSAVYNMARAGERILYVSLEFEPREVWEFLAFIHTHQFRDRLFLPSQNTWQMGKATPEDLEHMNVVIDDIKQRTTVPGLIDVQKFFTWDEIEGYFEANNTQNQYTVVVVDYLYKLNVECNSKYPGDIPKAKDAVISRAISWCHKKATFALISPHQVNREGHKGAKKDGSTGYDLDSLYQSSAVQQDADLVISVFSSDSARAVNSMTAKCLKHRGTEMFATHELKLDGRTKYVRDADEVKDETITKGKAEVARIWARQQAKQKAEAEARGETWTPTPIGGATETPITMPDTEVM